MCLISTAGLDVLIIIVQLLLAVEDGVFCGLASFF